MPKSLSRFGAFVGLLLVLAGGIALSRIFYEREPLVPRGPVSQLPSGPSAANLDRAVQAIAESENANYRAAIEHWNVLLKDHPLDNELLINQSVTMLKWIEELSAQLSSGSITDAAEILQRESELAIALTGAESTVSAVRDQLGTDPRASYIDATLQEAKSRRLAPPQDSVLRKQAAAELAQTVDNRSSNALLACKLDDLAQEFVFEDSTLAKSVSSSLLTAWQSSPRNLYLLTRAGENMLDMQDARLVELLEPSLDVAAPMMSMLRPRLAGRDPADIIATATQAIQEARWADAQTLRLWFNVLKSSTAFRPDMRLVKPDIMALLSTRFVQRWRADLATTVSNPTTPNPEIQIEVVDVEASSHAGTAKSVLWYDYNVDNQFELLIAGQKQVRLYATQTGESNPGNTLQSIQQLDIPLAIEGMVAADLFEVDAQGRPQVVRTVADLMQQKNASTSTTANQSADNVVLSAKQHDTLQEVIVWGSEGVMLITSLPNADNPQNRKLSLIADVPGLSSLTGVRKVVPLDLDSDGDLDLFCITDQRMYLLQNNGNRTFEDISQYSHLSDGNWLATDAVAADFDRDLDLDLICTANTEPHVMCLENILHSQFRMAALNTDAWKAIGPSHRLAIEELDGNGSWDVCALSSQGLFAGLTRTLGSGQVVSGTVEKVESSNAIDLAATDFDNDGLVDAIVASANGVRLYRGLGTAGFDNTDISLLDNLRVDQLAALDCNHDGRIEIAAIAEGQVKLIRQTSPIGDFVQVRVRGINDVNGGGRINHYSIGSVLELTSQEKYQARVIREPMVHFGLGEQNPSNLRIIFNNGLTQNLTKVPKNTLVHERQELKGSCPFVYGWDGERFQLITDLLWNAPLGLQIGRGKVLPDRRWEYLILPGTLVQPRNGAYELRITEELWEIAYFDHVALTAVDHPQTIDVYSNEKVGPPDIAHPKLFHSHSKVYPSSATDAFGRDVLSKLSAKDSNFVQPFETQICQGLCEPHYIELEFDQFEFEKDTKLFLTGWLHPTDTSLNIGLDQNPELSSPEPPSLWVPNESGQFVCVNPFIGFPGGKPKSIVIELGNPFLCADCRLRIAGSQQIYWDEAFVTATQTTVEIQSSPLKMTDASLRYRGFSKLLDKAADQPHWYDYSQTDTAPKWPPLEGPMTRYGSVADLLLQDDDRMVVMSSGDEIVIRFAIPDQPAPEGWVRDFVLHSIGWDKDSDVNTLAGYGSLPLPFKAMLSYPPPVTQAAEQARVMQLNSSTLINRNSASTFWIDGRRVNKPNATP